MEEFCYDKIFITKFESLNLRYGKEVAPKREMKSDGTKIKVHKMIV